VTNHPANIRRKLSPAELAYLAEVFGVQLGEEEVAEYTVAAAELAEALARIRTLEQLHAGVEGRDLHNRRCSFCGGESETVGSLAAAPSGAQICLGCATASVAAIERQAAGNA